MTLIESGVGSVFCDTSFFYACLDHRDVHHQRARTLLEEAATAHVVFYCTWDIVSETVTLLRYRCSYERALQFLDRVKPALRMVPYDESVQRQAEAIFRRLGSDKRLSLCDALSFVVVTVLLDHMPCLSFDRDFRQLGLTAASSVCRRMCGSRKMPHTSNCLSDSRTDAGCSVKQKGWTPAYRLRRWVVTWTWRRCMRGLYNPRDRLEVKQS